MIPYLETLKGKADLHFYAGLFWMLIGFILGPVVIMVVGFILLIASQIYEALDTLDKKWEAKWEELRKPTIFLEKE